MCEDSKGAPIGSLELPAAKGHGSEQLKSRVVCARLLDWCVNAQAVTFPLTVLTLLRPGEHLPCCGLKVTDFQRSVWT